MKRKVVICGGGPSRAVAPDFVKDGHDLWVVGVACPEYHSIAHTVFELHDYKAIRKPTRYGMEGKNFVYVDDLKKLTCRLFMKEAHPAFANATEFPLKELMKSFGTYFTSTSSYMLAQAIQEGYEEITIIGMELDKEIYREQRASIEYFIGFAQGRGITVNIHDSLPFLKTEKLYGYEIKL